MTYSHLTSTEAELWAAIATSNGVAGVSALTHSPEQLLAATANELGGDVSALTHSYAELLAAYASAVGGSASALTSSPDELLAIAVNALGGTGSALSQSTSELLASCANLSQGGGGGETPAVLLDFKNGVYQVAGINVALSDVLMDDPDDGVTFRPDNVILGTGYTGVGFGNATTGGGFKGAALTAILAGCSFVFAVRTPAGFEAPGALYPFIMDVYSNPDFNTDWYLTPNTSGGLTEFGDNDALELTGWGAADYESLSKVGATATSAMLSACMNGGAVETGNDPTIVDALNACTFGIGNTGGDFALAGTIESITIYSPAKTNGELQALTSL